MGSTEFADRVFDIVAGSYAFVAAWVLAYAYMRGGFGQVLDLMIPIANVAYLACYFLAMVRMARHGSVTLAVCFAASFLLIFVAIGCAVAGMVIRQWFLLLVSAILILVSIIGGLVFLGLCVVNARQWRLERVIPVWSLALVLALGSSAGRTVYVRSMSSGPASVKSDNSDTVIRQSPPVPVAPTAGEQASRSQPPAPTAPPQPGAPAATPGPHIGTLGLTNDEETLNKLQKLIASGESMRNLLRSIVDQPSAQRALPELTTKEREYNTLALQAIAYRVSAANVQKVREYGDRLQAINTEIKHEVIRIRALAVHERAVERAENRAAIQERLHRRPNHVSPGLPSRARTPHR